MDQRQDGETNVRDLAWFERIRRGDEAALAALFRAYYGVLHRSILNIAGSPELAEEAVQDVFVALWNRREAIELTVTLRSYLYRAVHNRAITVSRQSASRERLRQEVGQQSVGRMAPSADHLARYNEVSASVRAAVERLPKGCRDVFLLSRRDGLDSAEIAHALGITEKAVEMRLWRALVALRRSLARHMPAWLAAVWVTIASVFGTARSISM